MRFLTCWKDSTFLRRFHGWATVAWMLAIIPTVLWWKESVMWIGLMSCWANIVGHWSSWGAARVEVKQDQAGSE